MNEDFVSFDLAKKLKEKGFRYNKSNLLDRLCMENQINHPSISQVLKWLRKEHKIYIEPCILADADTDADGNVINEYTYWSFSVINIETRDMIYFEYKYVDDKRFDSYEQAANAGIEYVIDNLI